MLRRCAAAAALAACGLLLVPASSPAIAGGKQTAIERAPWSAALAYSSARYGGSGHQRYLCGATLISPVVVLTAAHCVQRTPFRRLGFAQGPHVEAITGRAVLSSDAGQATGVRSIHYLTRRGGRIVFVTGGARPLFRRSPADYDIALVRLAAPAGGTPIKLAGTREAAVWRPGTTGTVAGWGMPGNGRGRSSDQLLSVPMQRVGDGTCARRTLNWRGSLKLCAAGVPYGRGTCRGDSGSGLAVPVRTSRGPSFRLAGIVGYGNDPEKGRRGCSRAPTTFARVSSAPLRTLIQREVRRLGGGEVVGSGARPR